MNERESVFCINGLQATFPPNIMFSIVPIIESYLEKRVRKFRSAIAAEVAASNPAYRIGRDFHGNGRIIKFEYEYVKKKFYKKHRGYTGDHLYLELKIDCRGI